MNAVLCGVYGHDLRRNETEKRSVRARDLHPANPANPANRRSGAGKACGV